MLHTIFCFFGEVTNIEICVCRQFGQQRLDFGLKDSRRHNLSYSQKTLGYIESNVRYIIGRKLKFKVRKEGN